MDAVYYREGVIRPIVAAIKSLARRFRSIPGRRSGAREGWSRSELRSLLTWPNRHEASWQRTTLVAAGPGAGIAATFNTPIGVLFAIELMLPELSARTFLPEALATGTATCIGRIFLGLRPAFEVPAALVVADRPASLDRPPALCAARRPLGLVATAFIHGLGAPEDIFERIAHPYLRHAVGMFAAAPGPPWRPSP
jgi:chloride channel protein, CIC family